MYEEDLALNNLQCCIAIKPKQSTNHFTNSILHIKLGRTHLRLFNKSV